METSDVKLPKYILRRKFRTPQLPPNYRAPLKVQALVNRALTWRSCVLTSPTGYGKSTMLAYWYTHLSATPNVQPLWISLDESDRTPSNFLKCIAYVLCTVHPAFAELVEDETISEKLLLVELCNLIDEHCTPDTSYVLFLDNYNVAYSTEFDDTLLFLTNNTDDNIKWILSGSFRSQRLDDLRLTASMIELNENDYAMEADELHAFIAQLMPTLGEAEIHQLQSGYGTWLLPYSFAALALNSVANQDRVESMVNAYLNRHFTSTVMDCVDPETYEFLVETSLLETMLPSLCDAVRNSNNSVMILQRLCLQGLYCRFDKNTNAYVYEPLFRKYLLQKLLSMKPGLIGEMATRAMDWCAEHGENAAYVKYLTITNDPFYLVSCVDICADTSLGDPSSLTERFILAPSEQFLTEPELIWAAVWSFIATGEVDQAEAQLTLLPEELQRSTARRYVQAIGYALKSDSFTSRSIIREIFASEQAALPRELQCLLTHMEGEDCERLGSPKLGRELYQKALSLSKRTGTFYRLFDFYLLAHQHFLLGNFEDAREFASKGLAECEGNMPMRGEFNAIIANCLTERGELEEAAHYVKRALRKTAPQANADMYLDVNICAASYQRACANNSEALQIVSDALKQVHAFHVPRNMDISAHTLRLNLAIELNETSALRESAQILREFGANTDVLRSAPALLALAKLHMYEGDHDEAQNIIERSKQLCKLAGSRYFNTKLLITEAAFFAATKQHDRALLLMMQALELASKGGYIMVFLEGGLFARDMIMQIAAKQKISAAIRAHAKKVIATLNPISAEALPSTLDAEMSGLSSLTAREAEVLHLLNQGMTRFEIAEFLHLSQNTVKSHLKNIYSKLGAHSREDVFRIYQEQYREN